MASNTVTTTWTKNLLFESDNPSGNKITVGTDDPSALGPKALMLSSLAGCSGLDIISLLKKMRVEIADFKMDVTGELTEEHPKYYHTVLVEYHFYGTQLDEKKINKAVQLSVDKYCGVLEMFRKFATVKTQIHLHEK